jgi:hypothetical protein
MRRLAAAVTLLLGSLLVGAAGCGARSELASPILDEDAGGLPSDDANAPDAGTLDATIPADDAVTDAPSPQDATLDAALLGDGPGGGVDARPEASIDAALLCPVETHPPGTAYWAFLAGGSAPAGYFRQQTPSAMAVDPDGNLVVVGSFFGTIDIDGFTISAGPYVGATPAEDVPTSWDVFVVKFDPAGNVIFLETFGDGYNQMATAVAVDASGDIFLAGQFAGTITGLPTILDTGVRNAPALDGPYDVFLIKLNPEGYSTFSRSFGQADGTRVMGQFVHGAYPGGLSVDPAGNVVLSGSFGGAINFTRNGDGGPGTILARGTYDTFLAKLTGDGDTIYGLTFGTAGSSQAFADQTLDRDGNIILSGDVQGSIDLSGRGGAGPGVLTGNTLCGAGVPPQTAFLAKLDPAGKYIWGKTLPADGVSYAGAVRVDGAGGIVTLTDITGNSDFFDAGFVDDGGALPGLDGGTACEDALHRRLYTSVLSRFDADGGRLWSRVAGPPDTYEAQPIAVDGDGGSFVGFWARSSPGGFAGGVTKVDALGNTVWTRDYGLGGPYASSMTADPCGARLFFAGVLVNSSSMSFPAIDGGSIDFATDPTEQWDMFLSRLVQ